MGKNRAVPASQYLAQSQAAARWFEDATDRLRRAGAEQVAPDMFVLEVPSEDLDRIIEETLANKEKALES